MAFLGIDNRRDLPQVSYSTALDYFLGLFLLHSYTNSMFQVQNVQKSSNSVENDGQLAATDPHVVLLSKQ